MSVLAIIFLYLGVFHEPRERVYVMHIIILAHGIRVLLARTSSRAGKAFSSRLSSPTNCHCHHYHHYPHSETVLPPRPRVACLSMGKTFQSSEIVLWLALSMKRGLKSRLCSDIKNCKWAFRLSGTWQSAYRDKRSYILCSGKNYFPTARIATIIFKCFNDRAKAKLIWILGRKDLWPVIYYAYRFR